MKKIFFAATGIFFFTAVVTAQEQQSRVKEEKRLVSPASVQEQNTELAHNDKETKERAAAVKEKESKNIEEAFGAAGLTPKETVMAKEIFETIRKRNKEMDGNEKLSDEEKVDMKKRLSIEENDKLKDLIGDEKFNIYSKVRLKQKEVLENKKPAE